MALVCFFSVPGPNVLCSIRHHVCSVPALRKSPCSLVFHVSGLSNNQSTFILLSTLITTGIADSCTCPKPSSTSGQGAGSSTSGKSPAPTGNSTGSNNNSSGGPKWVIYSDKWITNALPEVEKVKGYNVFILSFLLTTGAADQATAWEQLDKNTKKQMKQKYNDAGIKVIVSAFGGTDAPTSLKADPAATANKMAQWVIDNELDGIDVDYEDFEAMNTGTAEEWLITFTRALRIKLPKDKYIITHAPVAPWFTKLQVVYGNGAYQKVNKVVGHLIDWYNIQFYNQNEYNDCDGLIFKSSNNWPGTSLQEIAQSGVPQEKLIIGKPATQADASNGWIAPDTLATCLQQAKEKGWTGGAMVWQYPNADATWIQTVRSKSWPVN